LIRTGSVTLNGNVRRDPETPTDLTKDRILVRGQTIRGQEKIYWMLNKIRGTVTTASDEKGRATVYEHLEVPGGAWIAPVGRLDKASEGLLLLTNDSEWAARITAPESHLENTYHVHVNAPVDNQLIARLTIGVETDLGCLRVKSAHVLRRGQRRTWLEIVLDEGKNRHIRRIFESLGIEVLRLMRVAIGPLCLGDLPKGATRPLTTAEKHSLDEAMKSQRVRG
jgi:23S rRNA pseudouridine2605 synthase